MLSILQQTRLPPEQRSCPTNAIQLISFGGHTVSNKFGRILVTRRNSKRISVGTLVSYHTATLLHNIFTKMSKNKAGTDQTHNARGCVRPDAAPAAAGVGVSKEKRESQSDCIMFAGH